MDDKLMLMDKMCCSFSERVWGSSKAQVFNFGDFSVNGKGLRMDYRLQSTETNGPRGVVSSAGANPI